MSSLPGVSSSTGGCSNYTSNIHCVWLAVGPVLVPEMDPAMYFALPPPSGRMANPNSSFSHNIKYSHWLGFWLAHRQPTVFATSHFDEPSTERHHLLHELLHRHSACYYLCYTTLQINRQPRLLSPCPVSKGVVPLRHIRQGLRRFARELSYSVDSIACRSGAMLSWSYVMTKCC